MTYIVIIVKLWNVSFSFFVFVCLFFFRHGYFVAVGRMRAMLNLIMVMTINMQWTNL